MQMVANVREVNEKTAIKSSKWNIYILYKGQNYCSSTRWLKIYLYNLDSLLAENLQMVIRKIISTVELSWSIHLSWVVIFSRSGLFCEIEEKE